MNITITSRVIPFATFMAFIGIEEFLRFLSGKGLMRYDPTLHLYLYPIRTVVVGLLLFYFWKQYKEVCFHDLLRIPKTILSLVIGIIVFGLWINMPWAITVSSSPAGYNPTGVSDNFTLISLISFRLFGAAVVVPIMEELFWRSFLVRYIINPNIDEIPIGRFTWGSFVISTLLFGLEHHLFFAGLIAGAAYSFIVYRTKSLPCSILSHGVTNLSLGVYVLFTGKWQFW